MSKVEKTLALEFSSLGLSLFEVEGDEPLACLAHVDCDAPDFRERAVRMSREVQPDFGYGPTVALWFAEDEVMLRTVQLKAQSSSRRRREAGKALGSLTPFRTEELVFDLGEPDSEGYTSVAAVPLTKATEAMDLARSIGMIPGSVTMSDHLDGFGMRPSLMPDVRDQSGLRRSMMAAGLVAVLSLPVLMASGGAGPFGWKSSAGAPPLLALAVNEVPATPAMPVPEAAPAVVEQDSVKGLFEFAAPPSFSGMEAEAPVAAATTIFVQTDIAAPTALAADATAPRAMSSISPFAARNTMPVLIPANADASLPTISREVAAKMAIRSDMVLFNLAAFDDDASFEVANIPAGVPVRRPGIRRPTIVAAPTTRPPQRPDLPPVVQAGTDPLAQPVEDLRGAIPAARPATSRGQRPTEPLLVLETDVAATIADSALQRQARAEALALARGDDPFSRQPRPPIRGAVPLQDGSGWLQTSAGATIRLEDGIEPRPQTPVSLNAQPVLDEPLRIATLDSDVPDLPDSVANRVSEPVAAAPATAPDVETEAQPDIVAAAPEPLTLRAPKRRPARVERAAQIILEIREGVASTLSPIARPAGFNKSVAAILEKRQRAQRLVAARQKPKPTTPSARLRIPTRAAVARVATIKDGISLGELSVIGIVGKSKSRKALLRAPNGNITKVKRGDRISGWSVASISEDSVRISRSGATRTLRLPN